MKTITDEKEWNSIVDTLYSDIKDIYYRYEYFNLYSKHYDVKPEAIFWEDDNLSIFWTHLIRDISKINQYEKFDYCDLTTPYGYGGPLIVFRSNEDKKVEESIKLFFEEYTQHCLKNNFVCEFIRFHPINNTSVYFVKEIDVHYLNDTVVVNLDHKLEELWYRIKKGHRYNIKKSIANGCEVEITGQPTKKDLEMFTKLYYETMSKNKASKKYYFEKQYIEDHFQILNSILVKVIYEQEIVCAAIFLLDGKIINYHLSGMNYNFKKLYLTDLMLWEAIKWGNENGYRYLHLGGGLTENDSLFKFKRGFSDDVRKFYIGKHVFDMNSYKTLLDLDLNSRSESSFFPAYRQNIETII